MLFQDLILIQEEIKLKYFYKLNFYLKSRFKLFKFSNFETPSPIF